MVTSILHELTYYTGRLTKNLLISSEILTDVAKLAGADKKEIDDLIHTQKREIDEIIRERIQNYSLTKKKKAEKKWGQFYPIYLSLDFLEPADLVKLLALSKSTRQTFKKKIYRTVFYNFGEKLTLKQRFQAWYNMTEIDQLNVDYKELLKQFEEASQDKSVKHIEEVIDIDVQRSFNNHSNCDPIVLKQLLKAYAAYDKDVAYCQGMNYMMGFLYINSQDPERSFKLFCKMMVKLRHLFDNEFKQLKKYFFKFTRIVELFIPDLAEHFKREKVESSFFIAPWFITAFANAFQYSDRSKFLEKIWDFFLIDGVKTIFRTGIFILLEYKEKLLEMKFDTILNFLSDMGRDEIFKNTKYFEVIEGKIPKEEASPEFKAISTYEKTIKNIHVTNQLLQLLDVDFEVLEVRLNKMSKAAPKK